MFHEADVTQLDPREYPSTRTPKGHSRAPVDFDLLCFSHLRWDFVFQRPQHLLSRCARERRVFFIEEPVFHDPSRGPAQLVVCEQREAGVRVVVPRLPSGLEPDEVERAQRVLLDQLIRRYRIDVHVDWYYTPMALGFSRHLRPIATIYDCMDELSAFLGAPTAMQARELELFDRADLVFTGGQSLYEAKRGLHPAVFRFPSSIDVVHFGRARVAPKVDPADQAALAHPRIGYFGVIDERLDLDLIAKIADTRPDWQLVMIGPVVKISPESLPRRANIHILGSKPYAALPDYIAGWDVAIMPFARNEATRFISPTKTPEYLAAGRPVVSTAIRDVVRPYGEAGLVAIADTPAQFVAAIEAELQPRDRATWLAKVDAFLAGNSWDATWKRMRGLIESAMRLESVCTTI
jgi:glycosyltransferase involved in cell wall biosynthesis